METLNLIGLVVGLPASAVTLAVGIPQLVHSLRARSQRVPRDLPVYAARDIRFIYLPGRRDLG